MAGGALGRLTVSLGLDAGEYISGLTKAELSAKQFSNVQKQNAKDVDRTIERLDMQAKTLGKTARETQLFQLAQKGATTQQLAAADAALKYGESFKAAADRQDALRAGAVKLGIAVGAALSAALVGSVYAFQRLINSAADFQDLAEKTGGSAEGLASFAVAAGTAGTSVEAIAQASIKLTKSLVGVDDESKAAGAAVAALGLDLGEFKKLSPEEQIETVSKALAGFKDGAEKTAVATALFGKSGAELLPFLKALEEQGGRQKILTDQQIKQADDYADAQARTRAELTQYAQAAATQVIPAITALTGAFSDVLKSMLGVGNETSKLSANKAIREFSESGAIALATLADGAYNAAIGLKALYSSLSVVALLNPAAIVSGIATKGVAGYADTVKATVATAQADLERLKTGLGLADKVRSRFAAQAATERQAAQENRGFTPDTKPTLKFSGAEAKEKKAATDEGQKYLEKLQAQLDKTRELTTVETLLSEIQSGRLKLSGKVTQAQLLDLAKLVDATKEATKVAEERQKQRTKDNDDALKASQDIEEADRSRLKALTDGGPAAQLEKQRKEMVYLAEAFEKGKISAEEFNDAATGFLDLKANTEKTKSLADELNLSFTSAFEDAIVGGKGLSDVLKGLEADLIRIVTRQLVTKPLGDALGGFLGGLGGGGSGGGLGGLFTSALGFITGKASGGPVSAGSLYRVAENGPETLDVGGDQYLMTGSKGGIVRPGVGGSMSGGPRPVNITYNSAPGESRKTAAQNGAALSRSLMFADQRGN